MPKPALRALHYVGQARTMRESWRGEAVGGSPATRRFVEGQFRSLATFELRAKSNPLTAGNTQPYHLWPARANQEYPGLANLFRMELAHRWRGFYTLSGEPGQADLSVLYLWDHPTYDREMGYAKK